MKENKIASLLKGKAIWLVFIIEVIIFAVCNPRFIGLSNITAIGRQVAVYGIASVGMTFVILIGGIDLATGSIIAFVNILCAHIIVKMGFNMWIGILVALLAATLVGTLNGFMVSTIGIPPIIATFASQMVFLGLTYILSGGRPISGLPDAFDMFGKWNIGPLPVSVLIMVACMAIGSFILNKTFFGRYFYAIGGNEEAAKLSGIRVGRMKYLIYSLSGLFAGIAGIVMLSRTGSAQNQAGDGYEFDVITCVVLGGVSVNGGVGKISGVVAGVLIIGCLTNGMILLNINTFTQMVVKGIVLAVAVGFDCLQKKKQVV